MKTLRTMLVVSLLTVVAVMATSLPASAHFHQDVCVDLGNGCEGVPIPEELPVRDPCRQIFSDGVCGTVDNPWPVVWWVTDPVVAIVTCTISFECIAIEP